MFTGVKSGEENLPVLRNLDADGHDVDLVPAYSAKVSLYQCSLANALTAARAFKLQKRANAAVRHFAKKSLGRDFQSPWMHWRKRPKHTGGQETDLRWSTEMTQ